AWRERRIQDAAPIHEHPVVLADLAQRAEHRDMARVIDVEPVDLGDRSRADPYLHDPSADRPEQPLALQTGQDLRVVHPANELRIGSHQARRRDDRTGERGHPDLVDADDALEALRPKALFMIQRGHDDLVERTGVAPVKSLLALFAE